MKLVSDAEHSVLRYHGPLPSHSQSLCTDAQRIASLLSAPDPLCFRGARSPMPYYTDPGPRAPATEPAGPRFLSFTCGLLGLCLLAALAFTHPSARQASFALGPALATPSRPLVTTAAHRRTARPPLPPSLAFVPRPRVPPHGRMPGLASATGDEYEPALPTAWEGLKELGAYPFPGADMLLPGESKEMHLYEDRFVELFLRTRDEDEGRAVQLIFANEGAVLPLGTLMVVEHYQLRDIGVNVRMRAVGRVQVSGRVVVVVVVPRVCAVWHVMALVEDGGTRGARLKPGHFVGHWPLQRSIGGGGTCGPRDVLECLTTTGRRVRGSPPPPPPPAALPPSLLLYHCVIQPSPEIFSAIFWRTVLSGFQSQNSSAFVQEIFLWPFRPETMGRGVFFLDLLPPFPRQNPSPPRLVL